MKAVPDGANADDDDADDDGDDDDNDGDADNDDDAVVDELVDSEITIEDDEVESYSPSWGGFK